MPNEFAIKPELDDTFPCSVATWTDPVTGISLPKQPDLNLQWRASILELAENDTDLQVDLYTAASKSILFFINAFVFTLRVFESTGEEGHVKQSEHKHLPFVTWEIQDTHILKIEEAINKGKELLTDKSRDMGATWSHIAVYVHKFLFRDSESHLVISRKEDAVDILDALPKNYPHGPLADPGTLFGKIDYILSRLPEWMLPRCSRKKLHLINLDTSARIDGESANATAGSSDRRTSIFLDEMAKMDEAESIKRSTRDVTACRLVCSTPNGAGTTYSKWRLSGTIPVFVLPWWEHPEKGRNRYVVQDDLGRWRIRSPWYDKEAESRSPKELAIEVDMDHVGSGDTFFEAIILEEHKRLFAKQPIRTISIRFYEKVSEHEIPTAIIKKDMSKVHFGPKGPWRLWCKLEKGRPDQSKTYTVAVDIGKGMGASNSVASVMCNETREKVAELASATIPPYEFAKLVCAAALWFGGKTRALVIWENNGDPGFDFGRQITKIYQYPNIYFDKAAGTIAEKHGKRYGWRSTREKKATALGMLRRAYATGGFINHSEEALVEAASYVHYEGGGIGPAELVEESSSARQTHGDRVIADMLLLVGIGDIPTVKREGPVYPHRSFGGRLKKWQDKKKSKKGKTHFNFVGSN